MDFSVTQSYAAPADAVARAYASGELYGELRGLPKLGPPEVLDRTSRTARGAAPGPLPLRRGPLPAVTAVIDPARLTWVEHSIHDLGDDRSPTAWPPTTTPTASSRRAPARSPTTGRRPAHGPRPRSRCGRWWWAAPSNGPSSRACASTSWPRRSSTALRAGGG